MLLYGFSTMESSQTTIPDCLAGVFLSVTFPAVFLRIIVALPQCDTPGFSDHDWDRFSRATFSVCARGGSGKELALCYDESFMNFFT